MANLYQPPGALSSKAKKRSLTSKNLLPFVDLVYVLKSVGASPGKLANVTGVAEGCRLIRSIGIDA
jgi:hypothetical protein